MHFWHYLKKGVAPPPPGEHFEVGAEFNQLWLRKLQPWRTSGVYPITDAHRDWARGEVARLGGTVEKALESLQTFRQERDRSAERAFEANRPVHLPSRLRCMYLWDDRDGFEADARSMGINPDVQALIKVVPVEGAFTIHRAMLDALEVPNNLTKEELTAVAQMYWASSVQPGPRTEVLLVGSYVIG